MGKDFQKKRNGHIDGLGLVVYTFNLSPGEAEASGSLVNSRPGLYGKFQAIQGWIVRPYIFKKDTMGLWKWLCKLELLFQRTGLPFPALTWHR